MTCEYPRLMAEDPDLTIPDVPLTVVARVYAKGDPLGGNICPPVNTSHPRQPCTDRLQYSPSVLQMDCCASHVWR